MNQKDYSHLKGKEVTRINSNGKEYKCIVAGIDPDKGITLIDIETGETIYCFTDVIYNITGVHHDDGWKQRFKEHVKEVQQGFMGGRKINNINPWSNAEDICPF